MNPSDSQEVDSAGDDTLRGGYNASVEHFNLRICNYETEFLEWNL
jgi:hypothetical protein